MVVIRLRSEQKGEEQQNNKRKDKEAHAYCDRLLQHMLTTAPFTMHTATPSKYVTQHVVFIDKPVMFP
jgi:hypothetical protein